MGANGGRWDYILHFQLNAKPPKLHFLLVDLKGGEGKSHFASRKNWGEWFFFCDMCCKRQPILAISTVNVVHRVAQVITLRTTTSVPSI